MDVFTTAWALIGAGLAYKVGSRIARGGKRTDAAIRRLAAALELEVVHGWGGDRVLRGEVGGFPVTVRVARYAPMLAVPGDERASVRAVISVDARSAVPPTLRLAAGDSAGEIAFRSTWEHLRREHLRTAFTTGDTTFDGQIRVAVDEVLAQDVLSLLDSATRLALRCAADRGDLRIDGGWIEGAIALSEAKALSGEARASLDALVALAPRLAVSMGEREVIARLAKNAIEDPIDTFRLNCLEVLLEKDPEWTYAKTALDAALLSRAPELQIFAAVQLDDPLSRRALASLAESEEAPAEIRVRALLEIAARQPIESFDLLVRALESGQAHVQVAALNGLALFELSLLPIERVLAIAEAEFDTEGTPYVWPGGASEAALGILERAREEEGERLDPSTRRRAIELLDFFARVEDEGRDRQRGRLSVARSSDRDGALSVADASAGEVSITEKRSS